jgi:hypothetical protein
MFFLFALLAVDGATASAHYDAARLTHYADAFRT